MQSNSGGHQPPVKNECKCIKLTENINNFTYMSNNEMVNDIGMIKEISYPEKITLIQTKT